VLLVDDLRLELVAKSRGGAVSEWEHVSQARKCTWWMPRHRPAMKDVASCEKPRGAASEHRSGGIRMGQPGGGHTLSLREQSEPRELKHLSTWRKRHQMRFPK
jgi:hypothetical protein